VASTLPASSACQTIRCRPVEVVMKLKPKSQRLRMMCSSWWVIVELFTYSPVPPGVPVTLRTTSSIRSQSWMAEPSLSQTEPSSNQGSRSGDGRPTQSPR
jgi:hypothetical protein